MGKLTFWGFYRHGNEDDFLGENESFDMETVRISLVLLFLDFLLASHFPSMALP